MQVYGFVAIQGLATFYALMYRPFAFVTLNAILIVGEIACLLQAIFLMIYKSLGIVEMTKIDIHWGIFYTFVILAYVIALLSLAHVFIKRPKSIKKKKK